MDEREKLISELEKLNPNTFDGYGLTLEQIADFILADRRRIAEPVIKCFDRYKHMDKLFCDVKIRAEETNPYLLVMFDLWDALKPSPPPK